MCHHHLGNRARAVELMETIRARGELESHPRAFMAEAEALIGDSH